MINQWLIHYQASDSLIGAVSDKTANGIRFTSVDNTVVEFKISYTPIGNDITVPDDVKNNAEKVRCCRERTMRGCSNYVFEEREVNVASPKIFCDELLPVKEAESACKCFIYGIISI